MIDKKDVSDVTEGKKIKSAENAENMRCRRDLPVVGNSSISSDGIMRLSLHLCPREGLNV